MTIKPFSECVIEFIKNLEQKRNKEINMRLTREQIGQAFKQWREDMGMSRAYVEKHVEYFEDGKWCFVSRESLLKLMQSDAFLEDGKDVDERTGLPASLKYEDDEEVL